MGRVFQIPIKEAHARKHPKIPQSEYVVYLGDAASFLKRLDVHIPPVEFPIFIAAG